MSEGKIFVLTDVISESTFSNVSFSEKNGVNLQDVFFENEIANTCKSERGLVNKETRYFALILKPLRREEGSVILLLGLK